MTTIHFPPYQKFLEYAGERDKLDPWSTYRQGWLDAVKEMEAAQPSVQRTGFWICPNCHITNAGFREICSECETTRR